MTTTHHEPPDWVPVSRHVAVRVTADAARHLRAGHPWLFASSVTAVSHDGAPGDLAVVFDPNRRFVAFGLYDPGALLAVRVLHHGEPETLTEDWWRAHLRRALERRAPLADDPGTTAYRLVHGENDAFGGLVVDRYDTTAVVKLYSPAWAPVLPTLVPMLVEEAGVDSVVVRLNRVLRAAPPAGVADGTALAGALPTAPVPYLENGLFFTADVVQGQKTGAFLDQRDNRALVRTLVRRGGRVLDVFACTGGFTVHAAAGGAGEVWSVDQAAQALEAARDHMALNGDVPAVAACRHEVVRGDAFAVMGDLAARRERFDLVIVDPPSFAARQASVPAALNAYERLTELAVALVAPQGRLLQASCSSRVSAADFFQAVGRAARHAGVELADVVRTGQPLDHPVEFPEGAYLKAVVARITRQGPAARTHRSRSEAGAGRPVVTGKRRR
jgi:23S rRNA (cytosine1962-C5)-methyltransferase